MQRLGRKEPPPLPRCRRRTGSLVSRIALYPDPLLAQVLAAATYTDEIPDAARWAGQHSYLHGDALAKAISEDQLPWDPSVQALLPFPSVLDMMARDMGWTSQVGNAFMVQQQDVMDAVQQERQERYDYGYLRTGPQVVVTPGPYIAIAPVNPGFYYVPALRSVGRVRAAAARVFHRRSDSIRRRDHDWGGICAVGLGPRDFGWASHAVIINDHPWTRTWVRRGLMCILTP